VRAEVDLIEAGLNEGAGRFAPATLWALCRARARFSRLGLPRGASMTGLARDRPRARARTNWERAPVSCDERSDFGRAQVASLASNCWRDGMGANRDYRRDGGAHEVSHQNGDALDRGHSPPRGMSATKLMAPPHSGQGGGSTAILSSGSGDAGSSLLCAVFSTWFVRSERQRASLSVRWPLARNPK
jgi:hypothetical protein